MSAKQAVEAPHAGYARAHRIYEICGIVGMVLTGVWLAARIACAGRLPSWWVPLALVLGIVGADLVSGIVHWGFDTWGHIDTPVVGRLAIRTFREHHLDPRKMLTHDFIETNGHNFALALSLTVTGLWIVPAGTATPRALFLGACLLVMAVFVSLTSQIHKWAHMDHPPRLAAWLQRARIFVSREHHALHHDAPHLQNYCITAGWLDGALRATRTFERVERLVSLATGITPRRHDPRDA